MTGSKEKLSLRSCTGWKNLLKEIFDRVQEHPEQMHRMHKLMDYYLPTMLKLVEQYAEFDEISSPGEDILDAKKRSKDTGYDQSGIRYIAEQSVPGCSL